MELLQLKYLCTAARYENFSRAAKHHNIPQSAISKTVAQLERELGVKLFLRHGNRVALSEAGRRFCAEVQTSLRLLDDATERARAAASPLSGEVFVAGSEHTGILRRAISAFCRENPAVTFRRESTPVAEADIHLLAAPHAGGGRVFSLPPSPVCLLAPASLLREGAALTPALLSSRRQVVLSTETPAAEIGAHFLRRAGHPTLVCDHPDALPAAVAAVGGFAFVAGLTPADVRPFDLSLFPLPKNPCYECVLVLREDASPAAEAFCRFFLEMLDK